MPMPFTSQPINRSGIVNALCNLLATIPDFRNVNDATMRRVPLWSKAGPLPALFVRKIGEEHARPQDYRLRKAILKYDFWIYTDQGSDPTNAPSDWLDELVTAIETVMLQPDNVTYNTLTLGGLVQHAWIEGEIVFDNGDADAKAKVIVPIHVLVP